MSPGQVSDVLEVKELPTDPALLERAGFGDLAAAGDLYDRYGAALYALAMTVTQRRSLAETAVVAGFHSAATSTGERGERAWRLLARATLAACPSPEAGQVRSRSLLALTLYGAHSYREAAALLGIELEAAAGCLREALRDRA